MTQREVIDHNSEIPLSKCSQNPHAGMRFSGRPGVVSAVDSSHFLVCHTYWICLWNIPLPQRRELENAPFEQHSPPTSCQNNFEDPVTLITSWAFSVCFILSSTLIKLSEIVFLMNSSLFNFNESESHVNTSLLFYTGLSLLVYSLLLEGCQASTWQSSQVPESTRHHLFPSENLTRT